MENQHRKISGYRDLSQEEIDAMNEVKAQGADQRWVSIGATELQQGLMALTRAIAQPTFF